jgi:replicative DNA helicase
MAKEFEPEYEVIGGLLIKPEDFESVSSQLSEEDFFSPQCKNIFLAIKELYQNGVPIDMTTILSKLKKEEDRKLSSYLEGEIPTAETLPYWVRRVREDSLRSQIVSETNKGDEMNGEKIEALAYQLNGLKNPSPTCQFFEDIPPMDEDSSPIIKTGFMALDIFSLEPHE